MSTLSDTNSQWSIRTGSSAPDIWQNRDQDFANNLSATGIVSPPNNLDKNTSLKLVNASTAQTQPLLSPRQKQPLPAPCSRKMSVPTTPPSTEATSLPNKLDENISPKLLNGVVSQKEPPLPPRQKQPLPAPWNKKIPIPTTPPSMEDTSPSNNFDKNTSPKLLNDVVPLLPPRPKQTLPAPCNRKMSVPTLSTFSTPSTLDMNSSHQDILDRNTASKPLVHASPQKQPNLPPRPIPKRYRKTSAPTFDTPSSQSDLLDENTSPKLLGPLPHRQKQRFPEPRYRKTSAPTFDTTSSQSDLLDENTSPKLLGPLLYCQKQTLPEQRYRKMSAPTFVMTDNHQMPLRTNENNYEHCIVPSRQAPPVPKSSSSFPQLCHPSQSAEINDGYLQSKLPLPLPVQENVVTNRQMSSHTNHSTSESSNGSYRRPHYILRRGNLIIISFISFLLSCISLSVLVLLVVKPFTNSWRSQSFREGEFSACVKCVYLVQYATDNNADLRSLDNENRAGGMFCCARRSEQFSNLMKLILRQPDYEPKSQIGIPHDVTPHAHKKLGYPTINIKDQPSYGVPTGHSMMKVSQENSTIFYNQSVLVSDYSLDIQVSGWYYVYSNIYYMTNCGREINYTVFQHTIGRISKKHSVKSGSLTRTEYTCCSQCTPQDHKSSFTGGIFELFQGDQIVASVSNISIVNFDESPYLGVVTIGEEF